MTERGPEGRRRERRHAGRVALGLFAPGCALLLLGHPELLVYAAFGSFTGMYGRSQPRGERLRQQLHGAGMLVAGSAIGITLSATGSGAAALLGCVTAFATCASWATDRVGLSPGGPFFGIFALGATASIPSSLTAPWTALAICGGTAAFSVALGLAEALAFGSESAPEAHSLQEGAPSLTGTKTHALRYAVATGSAGAAGLLLGLDHANWAMAAAAVPLAVARPGEPLSLNHVVTRAQHRLAGTFAGLLVASLLLLPDLGAGVLAGAVMLAIFPTELFMTRHYGVALGFFTPLIMCMTQLAAPGNPAAMLVARGVENVIGVLAGVAAAFLVAAPASTRTHGARLSPAKSPAVAEWRPPGEIR